MAARSEDAAANGRTVFARFPFREVATIVGVVFTATSALIVGMQWAVSNNTGPLFLLMQDVRSQVVNIRDDVDVLRSDVDVLRSEVGVLRTEVEGLRTEVGDLRAEVAENRGQIADLRERVAKVEVGLGQVQANQVRILDILEHEPHRRE